MIITIRNTSSAPAATTPAMRPMFTITGADGWEVVVSCNCVDVEWVVTKRDV